MIDQKSLRSALRKRFPGPGGPRQALKALGLDEAALGGARKELGLTLEQVGELDKMLLGILDEETHRKVSEAINRVMDKNSIAQQTGEEPDEGFDAGPMRKIMRDNGMPEEAIDACMDMMGDVPGNGGNGMGRSGTQNGQGGMTPRPAGMDSGAYVKLVQRQREATALVGSFRATQGMFGDLLTRIHHG